MHQQQYTNVLQIATRKQSTHRLMKISSIAVETSRSTSKVTLSCDKQTKFISYLTPRRTVSTCLITMLNLFAEKLKLVSNHVILSDNTKLYLSPARWRLNRLPITYVKLYI